MDLRSWRSPTLSALAPVLAIFAIAAPPPVSPTEIGPLAPLVEVAFGTGFGGPLSGRLCTALGITIKDESFPVEQLSSGPSGDSRSFNVSRHRGWLDIVISRNTNEETLVFLTTAAGNLQKAVREKKDTPTQEIPLAEAAPFFDAEKTWWLDTWMKTRTKQP